MNMKTNEYGQPVGEDLPDWIARARPSRTPMLGRYCRLEPLQASRHASDLFNAFSQASDGRDWTYMYAGPFADEASYHTFAESIEQGDDPVHYAVIDLETERAVGSLALMRIDSQNGVIEVGHVAYSPRLKRTRAATEAQYLLMRRAFDELGYRRYEWKCDSLNAPSRSSAARLGFTFEGIYRQIVVYKGRTRDTAWFSIIDSEWLIIREGFERWLAAENFDNKGEQRLALSVFIGV
jgi:RimJ/RimL family protein N-acetyltransferase